MEAVPGGRQLSGWRVEHSHGDAGAFHTADPLGRHFTPGGYSLTEREREVLALMAEGRSNQAICDRLFLAPKTVEAHIANIYSRLELLPEPDDHRRVLAVLAWLRHAPG